MPLSPLGGIFQSTNISKSTIIARRAKVVAVAVENQHGVLGFPMRAHALVGCGLGGGQFVGGHFGAFRRVGHQALPAVQIVPVEKRRESFGRRVFLLDAAEVP